MNELIILFTIVVFGVITYLLHITGVIADISNLVKKLVDKLEIPNFGDLFKKEINDESSSDMYYKKQSTTKRNDRYDNYRKTFDDKLNEIKQRKRGSSKGSRITNEELNYLWEGIASRRRVQCINCRNSDMYSGSQSGNSQQWHCPNCGQSIMLSIISPRKDGIICYNDGIDKRNIK